MEFSNDPIISIKEASIFQDDVAILTDINFDVAKGEFVYLIGKTGSGKSSLLKTLYADLPLATGKAKVAGYDLRRIGRSQVPPLRRKIGIIFQDFQLLNDRTVAENLLFVMRATGWKDRIKMKMRLTEVLTKVGLSALATKMPHQLSGGEQQRIVIARALINEPLILIADEPTGNLDPEIAQDILHLFIQINKSGTAILMATHNYQFLHNYPARVLKVENAKVIDSAKTPF
jgi:cell division transport system ATP-binding protein